VNRNAGKRGIQFPDFLRGEPDAVRAEIVQKVRHLVMPGIGTIHGFCAISQRNLSRGRSLAARPFSDKRNNRDVLGALVACEARARAPEVSQK